MTLRTIWRPTCASGAALLITGLALLPAAATTGDDRIQERTAPKPRPEDAAALADFEKRVKEYMEIQKTLSRKVSSLPEEASPATIDKHQRALASLVENARRTARPGDIFTPAVQTIVRRELGRIFGGPDGKQLLASIMDENPVGVTLRVNSRYPDQVPMSTMPPEVLAVLPPLPEELNYRFISDQLILFDTMAHLVVDYVSKALPGAPGAKPAAPAPAQPAPGAKPAGPAAKPPAPAGTQPAGTQPAAPRAK